MIGQVEASLQSMRRAIEVNPFPPGQLMGRIAAIHLQRLYAQALKAGFPFDRGLRIAINFGEYRLLPLDAGPGNTRAQYEYFGHGLVELSRLTTGKKTQEVDEFKTYRGEMGPRLSKDDQSVEYLRDLDRMIKRARRRIEREQGGAS